MNKSPDAFRTISEVAEWLDVPKHVLRFWESKFAQVKPVKRAGGRRYYRPADMELLGGIKRLLHDDGLTIRGVQKILREEGVRHVANMSPASVEDPCEGEDAATDLHSDLPGPKTMPRTEPDPDCVDAVLAQSTDDPDETELPGPDTMPREEPDPGKVDAIMEEAAPEGEPPSGPEPVRGDAPESEAAPEAPDASDAGACAAFDLPLDLVSPAPPILADLLCLSPGAFARAGVDPAPILDQAEALARSMDGHGR